MDPLPEQQNPPTVPVLPMPENKHKVFFLVSGVVALLIIVVGGVILLSSKTTQFPISDVSTNTSDTPSSTDISDESLPYVSLVTPEQLNRVIAYLGTTTPTVLKDKYSVFVVAKGDSVEGWANPVVYFEDGVISSGQYAGYHRLIAQKWFGGDGPGGPGYLTFATKDYKTFVVQSSQSGVVPSPNFYNTNVVVGVADFPTSFPSSIILNDKFVLELGDIQAESNAVGTVELSSTVPGLHFFSEPIVAKDIGVYISTSTIPTHQTFLTATDKYVGGRTEVLVRDESGVGFIYSMAFSNFGDYNNPNNKKPEEGGSYGYLEVAPSQANIYSSYGELFPRSCAGANTYTSYVLKNVSDSDVSGTGITWQGVSLYAFVDKNHPLLQAQYYAKSAGGAAEYRSELEAPYWPSYQDYVKQPPILMFKDSWGRWVAVGEQQYTLPGGCGKPVIYLYPTQPIQVNVQFEHAVQFKVDIPSYSNGWNILANPDGKLVDLQQEATNCGDINSTRIGSEYAKDACESGTYPYLYWAGEANGTYPTPTGGWIVSKNNVENFLETKLQELGLNDKERQDMISFWVPELMIKHSPYYRLSFFQTMEMNSFIPMDITPHPDSMLRVFLDWSPLTSLPERLPEPQQLRGFERRGFTYVEWGGLEQ